MILRFNQWFNNKVSISRTCGRPVYFSEPIDNRAAIKYLDGTRGFWAVEFHHTRSGSVWSLKSRVGRIGSQTEEERIMLIEVLNRNVQVESETREWIKRRLHLALGRFVARIRRVAIIVDDINGLRGGNDKRCRLRITLIPKGCVLIEDMDSTVEAATAHAVERAVRSVIRALERQREYRVEPEICEPAEMDRSNTYPSYWLA